MSSDLAIEACLDALDESTRQEIQERAIATEFYRIVRRERWRVRWVNAQPYLRGFGIGCAVILVAIAAWVRLNLDVATVTTIVQLRQSVDALKDEMQEIRDESRSARRCPL